MIRMQDTLKLPSVGLSGFEPPLTDDERAIQETVHRFAKEVLRPLGRELDAMTSEEAIAPGSPYWGVFAEAAKLGLDPTFLAQFEPATAIKIESMMGEELGWGDAGLGVSLGVASFPLSMAMSAGNQELVELCTGRIGCWLITQPDRGSDVTVLYREDWPERASGNKGNLTARVTDSEIILNGQSSAWVSNGAVAQVALCYIVADYGDGFYGPDGLPNGLACIVPLDIKGVSRGKPLEKIGQRALPQGEIYFDDVRIPKRFAIALKDQFYGNLAATWSFAGTHMCQVFTGVARSAFEHALAYAHERRQGGAPLIEHQLTRYRLGDMARRVEMTRAIARRSLEFARTSANTHPYVTGQAKVSVTEEAMKIVHEAFQLFGGNGTTREYPIEKIFRDARSALIEDGENYMLTMRLGVLVSRLYQDGWTQA
jgi:alkylation response protein AidB-like acyl-CoA dehydrogenase